MLCVEGLQSGYGTAPVLRDVCVDVLERECVAVVGSNGAGKTTLLRTLSGLLRPSGGSIAFRGQRIDVLPPHKIVERGLVHVPEGRRIWPRMTVEENLFMGAYHARARRERSRRLDEVYSLFPRLKERRLQWAGTLSGGEQQMLAIGRALMACPALLTLDEPSLGLAPVVVDEVYEVINRLRQSGMAILVVEQDISRALQAADRAYVLENGTITMEGLGKELIDDPRIRASYLGLEQTAGG
ncbi:MAG: ABC transporter ATP-binding protein [Bacillota bacterium]